MKTLRILLVAVGFFAMVAITPARAAGELVLKLEGISGDSIVSGHVGEIDVATVGFGVSQTGIREAGGRASARRSSLTTISVAKFIDKSSPNLFLACATGQHIPKGVLTFRKAGAAGAAPYEFLIITLSDVLISSYQVSSSEGAGAPAESLSLSYTKIEYKYVPIGSNGLTLPPITVTFDVFTNKEFTLAQ
jgi:type VI secretion system secreted protein Hcp